MSESDHNREIIDSEHLRLLAIGYLVSAGMTLFFSLFVLVYAFMGALIGKVSPASRPNPNMETIAQLFSLVGFGIFALMVALAALKLRAASCLTHRRGRLFCMVAAAVCCVSMPYGTLLGIFTFIVLCRPSVVSRFEASAATPPSLPQS